MYKAIAFTEILKKARLVKNKSVYTRHYSFIEKLKIHNGA